MFRAFKQIIILIIFLLLTVFSSFYFQEKESGSDSEQTPVIAGWVIGLVKTSGKVLVDASNFSEAFKANTDIEHATAFTENKLFDNEGIEIDKFKNKLFKKIEESNNKEEKSEFGEFLSNFLRQTPKIYFDAKIYSNAWQNLSSVYNFSENWRN